MYHMGNLDLGFIIRSVILQLVVFSLIPIIWWCFKGRKKETFLNYFGLTKPKSFNKKSFYVVLIYCVIWSITHLPIFTQYTQTSSNAYLGLGISAILPIILVSFIQQGLSEELLFRGFINKRLVNKMGFQIGTTLQAILFGAMHVIFSSNTNLGATIIIFGTTFIGGYCLGYLSEKSFKGSIIPAIILHGLGNCIINLIQAFS